MKMSALLIMIASVIVSSVFSGLARGACEVVRNGSRMSFDGSKLSGLQVEKKSLVLVNKEFPSLNIVERAFKGELQTCTICTFAYITCQ